MSKDRFKKAMEDKKKKELLRKEYYKIYTIKKNKSYKFLNDNKEMVLDMLRKQDIYDVVSTLNVYILENQDVREKYQFSSNIKSFIKAKDIENFLFVLEKEQDKLLNKILKKED